MRGRFGLALIIGAAFAVPSCSSNGGSPQAAPSTTASCAAETMVSTVRTALAPVEIARVVVHECAGGFARVEAMPRKQSFNIEQVFLRISGGGKWTLLANGSGIDCARDPAEELGAPMLAACKALGLRATN